MSPWLEPRECGGVKASNPITAVPRLASCHADALPWAPRPTMMTSADLLPIGSLPVCELVERQRCYREYHLERFAVYDYAAVVIHANVIRNRVVLVSDIALQFA